MGHLELNAINYTLSDGQPLLADVHMKVGEGSKVALMGPNGAGKTTLTRIVTGDLAPHSGSVTVTGGLGVMRQFVGSMRDDADVRSLLLSVAPAALRVAADALERAELAMMERDEEAEQMAYAQAMIDFGDAGGYDYEATWDVCTMAALGVPYAKAQFRSVSTLSGGEQKRLVLEALLRGPEQVLLLDEPDNYLDVPGKRWLEQELAASPKTVLLVSHDRELIEHVADRIATLEPGADGSTLWVHPGNFSSYTQARLDRNAKLAQRRVRWDEERAKLKALVTTYRQKSTFNSDMASRLQAAETRLERFEREGPPQEVPIVQSLRMRLDGGRTAKRAVTCEQVELTGLMAPFDLDVWFGERVAILGSNGSGKSHFLRLLAAGGSRPEPEHEPVGDVVVAPVAHTGRVTLGSRVRPGWFAQTHEHPNMMGRTLLDILHHGDGHRQGMGQEGALKALDRYGLAKAAERRFEQLSGGQQARFQILLLELSRATLLLLDEPTDNLDLESAEALENALASFEGTVVAVTHDRWFARGFDRWVVFGADGRLYESSEPIWDEARVRRQR